MNGSCRETVGLARRPPAQQAPSARAVDGLVTQQAPESSTSWIQEERGTHHEVVRGADGAALLAGGLRKLCAQFLRPQC